VRTHSRFWSVGDNTPENENGSRIHSHSSLLFESEAWVCCRATRLSKKAKSVISHTFYTWSKLDCSLLFYSLLLTIKIIIWIYHLNWMKYTLLEVWIFQQLLLFLKFLFLVNMYLIIILIHYSFFLISELFFWYFLFFFTPSTLHSMFSEQPNNWRHSLSLQKTQNFACSV